MRSLLQLAIVFAPSLTHFVSSARLDRNGIIEGSIVPNAFILQSDCPDTAQSAQSFDALVDVHVDQLLKSVLSLDTTAITRQVFKSELFCGLSVRVGPGVTKEHLSQLPAIKSVTPVRKIKRPTSLQRSQDRLGRRPRHLQGYHDYLEKRGVNPARTVRPPVSTYLNDTFSPHVMTGVDQLHNRGLIGVPNVRTCLIDTGADVTNKLLGGCFGPQCLVSTGYDFVGDDGNSPKASPQASCASCNHGSHTLGTVGALYSEEFGFSGAAPGVSLGAYRIYDCYEESSNDILIAAVVRAVHDGCNIISMSLGHLEGGFEGADDPLSPVLAKAAAKNVMVIAASGNDGESGTFMPNTPATMPGVFAVGAANVETLPVGYEMQFENPSRDRLVYFSALPINISRSLELSFFALTPLKNGSCGLETSSAHKLNFADKLVVMKRDDVCRGDTTQFISDHGGRIFILYDLEDSQLLQTRMYFVNYYMSGLDPHIQRLIFPSKEALKLLELYRASNGTLKVNFRLKAKVSSDRLKNTLSGGEMASYSEYGPTLSLRRTGVDVAAPGTSIMSTVPVPLGSVGVDSGTSMACPLAAGIASLLLSHRRQDDLSPADIASLLSSTANPIPVNRSIPNPFASVIKEGAGMIQAYSAYKAQTIFNPYQVALNDTKSFNKTHRITIKNIGDQAITYTLGEKPFEAQSLRALDSTEGVKSVASVPSSFDSPAVQITSEPKTLTLAPHSSGTFEITFEVPTLARSIRSGLPIYSGFVHIKATGDAVSHYSLPYFGVGTDLSTVQILDDTEIFVSRLFGFKNLNFPFLSTADFPEKVSQIVADHGPVTKVDRKKGLTIFFRAIMPTSVFIDAVDASVDFVPTYGSGSSNKDKSRPISSTPITFDSVPILGQIAIAMDLRRNDDEDLPSYNLADWDGGVQVGKSTKIVELPAGKPYRMLLRALKLRSDPKYESSYESWLSPPFMFDD